MSEKERNMRELLADYAQARRELLVCASNFRSDIRGALTHNNPNLIYDAREKVLPDHDAIVDKRLQLSEMQSEFYIAYGKDLEKIFLDEEQKNGIDGMDEIFGIRDKNEILREYARCRDDYAFSSAVTDVVSSVNEDNGYYHDVKVDENMAKALERDIYEPALQYEWEHSYPDDNFWDALSEYEDAYDKEQLDALKSYIDLEKQINMQQAWAADMSAIGDGRAYKQALEKIADLNGEQRALCASWAEAYGQDSMGDAAVDSYERIYPNDDFEWYVPEDEEQAGSGPSDEQVFE